MPRLLLNEICWPDGSLALIARGVVDDQTIAAFETELTRALSTTPVNLLVDVTECELAAAGLAALLHLDSHLVSKVVLIAGEPAMLGILRIAGVTSRYRIYPTLERALNGCRASGGDPVGEPSDHVATPTVNAGRSQWLRIGTSLNG
ncbi:MAG: hypothetical protein QOE17_2596 [Gaiellales bacterium]|jgi:hypothetical protein|nr:hypothetical protein [Gaiellales bacterium]